MKKSLELCKARHNTPATDGAIFDNAINPLDLSGMQSIVASQLVGVTILDLYVTGLSVALVEVIKYCYANNIDLTLWHFNRDNNSYYPQSV